MSFLLSETFSFKQKMYKSINKFKIFLVEVCLNEFNSWLKRRQLNENVR
jgi:hypothetical protein